MLRLLFTASFLVACALVVTPAAAINITVDYRYDINNFFSTQQRRDALQAAADRYSEIITTSLSAVTFSDNNLDPRIGFTHPGNDQSWQVSPANSQGSDALVSAGGSVATEYRGPWSIAQDEWILYAGGQSISSAGEGGTGTGLNFTSVFNDGNSHLNRGFRSSGSTANLPLWGGSITFDNDADRNWHFGLNTAAPAGTLDFYTIAIHEIGHALGLSTGWQEWETNTSSNTFVGANAVAAAAADNGAPTTIGLAPGDNPHFADNGNLAFPGGATPPDPNASQSFIFNSNSAQLAGTVGLGTLQDLLMEPIANTFNDLSNPANSLTRFELTNVDVAALEDIGWTVIDAVEPPPTQVGDYDGDLLVTAADYSIWRDTFQTPEVIGTYAEWTANFGANGNAVLATTGQGATVPEPTALLLIATGLTTMGCRRRLS